MEKLSPQDVLKKQMCANAVANGGRLTAEDFVAFTRPYGVYESERYADIAHGIDKYRIKTGDLTGLNKTEKRHGNTCLIAWKENRVYNGIEKLKTEQLLTKRGTE